MHANPLLTGSAEQADAWVALTADYPWTTSVHAVHQVSTTVTRVITSPDGTRGQLKITVPWINYGVSYPIGGPTHGGRYLVHATATPDLLTGTWAVDAWAVPAHTDPALGALAEATTLAGAPHATTLVHPRPPKRSAGTLTEQATADRVYSLLIDAAHRAAIAVEYAPIVDAVPGLVLGKVTYPKSMSGTWHGYRFTLRAKGRKCVLHIRLPRTGDADAHQPLWTGTAELPAPLPFLAQIPGTAAQKYLTALRMTAATLRVSDGPHASTAHPATMPAFTVTDPA